MIWFESLTEAHARALQPQADQAALSADSRVKLAMELAASGPAWAVLSPRGLLAIGGIQEAWEGRGVAWALLADIAGANMLALTRATRKKIDGFGYRRMEMYVNADFPAGCRWARMLGFELETPTPVRKFAPDGSDAYLYGRVK